MHDKWMTSMYSGLCFERKRWVLYVQQRDGLPRASTFLSAAFTRFPLQIEIVPNRTVTIDAKSATCRKGGATFLADLRHGGGATMGIAHFAKRILRLHGLQREAAGYGLPPVARISFPATSAAHLAHSWPKAMRQLVNPDAAAEPVELMSSRDCCYDTVVVSARENTYFLRAQDANVLRTAAYRMAGVPVRRDAGAPVQACYFQRSEGKPGGRWEGGARVIVNRRALLSRMAEAISRHAPGGVARLVNINSTHTFAQQVSALCRVPSSTASQCVQANSRHASFNVQAHLPQGGLTAYAHAAYVRAIAGRTLRVV